MLNYGDAIAHLHIARRVFDSHRPGLSQLGSVWLPLPHLLMIPFAFGRYGTIAFLVNPPPSLGGPSDLYPPDYGYGLGEVYGIWMLVVLIMYPLCLWFSRLKERRRDWWLGYI